MNYQTVLSKVYFDVGLKQVAAACGFKGETLTSLQRCSHFKNTHYFLVEVWEALYLEMLDKFLLENNEANSLLHEIISQLNPVDLPSTRQQCQKTLKKFHEIFLHFVVSKEVPNWKFWSNFVKSSCFSYIALFCAICSGNWDLRLASMFTAYYDRPTYRGVTPAPCRLYFATGIYFKRFEKGRV